MSVAAAIVFGALPFLMRPTRLVALGALLVAVPCAALAAVSLPTVVVASVLLGWGAAALPTSRSVPPKEAPLRVTSPPPSPRSGSPSATSNERSTTRRRNASSAECRRRASPSPSS